MDLYIYKYNNYYNRIVKKEETLADYGPYIHVINGCKDFSPNDGVNTQHIFGSAANAYDGSGDYLIVTKDDEIVSRWFIIETQFTRSGQWLITLHRDLIVDYYEDIVDAPCFIEKATLGADDPLIFNAEQMTVNQIKKNEQLLTDKTKCPWLVGYYAKKTDLQGTVPINLSDDIPHINLDGALSQWEFYPYCSENEGATNFIGPAQSATYKYIITVPGIPSTPRLYETNALTGATRLVSGSSTLTQIGFGQPVVSNMTSAFQQYGMSNLKYADYSLNKTQAEFNSILSFDGKIIKDTTTGKYYSCTINTYNTTTTHAIKSGSLFNGLGDVLRNFVSAYNPTTNSYTVTTSQIEVSIKLKELKNLEQSYHITSSKLITESAPYDIFAIPYGEIIVKNASDETIVTTNADYGMTAAAAIQANAGKDIIYDIQLLPFCPVQELISNEKEITVTSAQQYSLIKKSDDESVALGIIFNVPKDNFSFDITDVTIAQGQTAIERKINSECNKWRLTSPNYSNYFDFNAEMNNGVEFFNVDCNYKPYSPYIHINPNFNGLYGSDYNDPRGLILGGDFSLTQVTDAWVQYQIQNKNYQNIFDRQIQNMNFNKGIGLTQDIVGAAVGTVQGAVAGAAIGKMGSLGAKTGGIIGGVTSGVAGAADIVLNEALRNEAINYTEDLFKFNLGNIQALPDTISKISAFNNNNKVFPVLEYYSCTDREKLAFAKKVGWNGMTVGVIDEISNYINNSWNYENVTSKGYIKGKIIRIDTLEDEYHLLVNIAEEINKGVYF